jgi:hypothetical protein
MSTGFMAVLQAAVSICDERKTMRWKFKCITSIIIALSVIASAQAGEVRVYALSYDKATLSVNRSRPKQFRAGDTPAPGLKLVAATSRYATINVNGRHLKLALGEMTNFRAAY